MINIKKEFGFIVIVFITIYCLLAQATSGSIIPCNTINSSNILDVILNTSADLLTENIEVESLNQDNILKAVGIDIVENNATLQNNQIYASDYGGAYIDSDGNINILLVDGSSSLKNIVNDSKRNISKKVIKSTNSSKNNKKVKLKKVIFSQSDLQSIFELLDNNSKELDISMLSTDISINKVVIGITSDNKCKQNIIKDFVLKNKTIKSKQIIDAITFENVKYKIFKDI